MCLARRSSRCERPRARDLAVVADAVSTLIAYPSPGLTADLAIFVGVGGGVGGFMVQLARALGAHVVGIDVDKQRLAALAEHGVGTRYRGGGDPRAIRQQISAFAKERLQRLEWKIFETSAREGQDRLRPPNL